MKRKSKKSLDAKIIQIARLVIKINRETKHDLNIEIDFDNLWVGGWLNGHYIGKEFEFYENIWLAVEPKPFAKLNEIIAKLKNILPKGK